MVVYVIYLLIFDERILTSPYEDRDGWDINVMCVDGTLYLEEHLSDEKLREK